MPDTAVNLPPPPLAPQDQLPRVARTILHVAWMSIALGMVLQVVAILIAKTGIGAEFVRDLGQKVAWSMFVCMGLAIGNAAARTREVWMGLAGLIAAPVAFTLAKMTHKSLGQALSLGGGAEAATSHIVALMTIKAIEYGLFGFILGRLSQSFAPFKAFARTGFWIGVVFSTFILGVTVFLSTAAPPVAKLIGIGVNELLFPIGCGTVVYTSGMLARLAANSTHPR